ncbi:MAG TPA: response regulator [Elusimicrobiota bacterium]|jgi:two-component system response regulator RegX3|nr:response regulator [Elusimicrobiota bacterium]
MAEETANPPAGEPLGDPRTKMVLVVDDDEALLNLLEILVRRDGFEVILANNGETALQKLARKPHAVLLDLILPNSQSGLDVLRHIGAQPTPHPEIIVITGLDAQQPAVQEAKKNPLVKDFHFKPINQEKLLGQLHRLLKTRPAARKPRPEAQAPRQP